MQASAIPDCNHPIHLCAYRFAATSSSPCIIRSWGFQGQGYCYLTFLSSFLDAFLVTDIQVSLSVSFIGNSHPGCLMLHCGCTGLITRSITRSKATTCDYMHTRVPRLLCETLSYVSKQDALLSSAMPCYARSVLHFDRCHSSCSMRMRKHIKHHRLSMYLHVTQAPRRK